MEFEKLFCKSGAKTKTEFILAAIFGNTIRVVTMDKPTMDYYIALTNLQSEYRRIGVNYNQVTRAIQTRLTEKKVLAFLYRLEELTRQLVEVNRTIIRLTQSFKEETIWLPTSLKAEPPMGYSPTMKKK